MESIYKYRFDRHTIYWSAAYLAVFVLLGSGLYILYEGGYLSAWFTSFVIALVALLSLSIPRRIVITDERVEVRCLLDITTLQRDEIAAVRRVEASRMKWFMPLFGGCGFFGYYGHYLDLKRFERVRIYASEWRNFVEIIDIYEDRLFVSCTQADQLVAELTPAGGNQPIDEDEDEQIGMNDAEEVVKKVSTHIIGNVSPINRTEKMKKYRCTVCEWIYDPAVGDPDGGIAPGTPFEEIPNDWTCPLCGVGKDDFEVVEE